MNDIREWISDNLRYLLLGLVGIIVIIVLVVVIKVATGGKDESKPQKKPAATASEKQDYDEEETQDAELPDFEDDSAEEGSAEAFNAELEKNDPDVLDVMTRYYTAWSSKDFTTLRSIDPTLSPEDEADIQNNDAIESISNITVYSAEGLDEDSRIVYAYFDVKVVGIETPAPTLTDFYLVASEDGSYVISDKYGSQALVDFNEKMKASSAVQDLIREVNQKLETAASSDADLKEYIVSLRSGGKNASDGGSDDGAQSGNGAFSVGSTVKSKTNVNVRSEASTNGVIYGNLATGTTAEILEEEKNEWIKIRYKNSSGVTIEGFVMAQYLEAE